MLQVVKKLIDKVTPLLAGGRETMKLLVKVDWKPKVASQAFWALLLHRRLMRLYFLVEEHARQEAMYGIVKACKDEDEESDEDEDEEECTVIQQPATQAEIEAARELQFQCQSRRYAALARLDDDLVHMPVQTQDEEDRMTRARAQARRARDELLRQIEENTVAETAEQTLHHAQRLVDMALGRLEGSWYFEDETPGQLLNRAQWLLDLYDAHFEMVDGR